MNLKVFIPIFWYTNFLLQRVVIIVIMIIKNVLVVYVNDAYWVSCGRFAIALAGAIQ